MRKIIFIFAAVLMALMTASSARAANEAYAVYDSSSKTLTFEYGTKPTTGTVYSLNQGGETPGWIVAGKEIVKVVFDASFANARPTSTYSWFDGLSNLATITGLSYLNTSNVTNMSRMFSNCSSLTSLDLTTFNTQKVKDMSGMFENCTGLTSLDVSSFNTENVESMWSMFSYCTSLKSLNLTSFNTSKVTNMGFMFYYCQSLETLMFNKAKFITDNVTDMSYMFSDCSKLPSLLLNNFNTEKVTDMSYMFGSCSNLMTLDIRSFNTSAVTNMEGMFAYCSNLTDLDVSSFNTANVTNMSSIFYFCESLTYLSLTNFNTENAESIGWMFSGCSSLTSIDISSFDTRNVTEMSYMFAGCNYLETIEVGDGWNTDKVTSSDSEEGMFNSCFSLVGGQGTRWADTNPTDKTYARIDGNGGPGYFTGLPAPRTYAAYKNKTLSFYYDGYFDKREAMNATIYYIYMDIDDPAWIYANLDVEKVVFDKSFAEARPLYLNRWFSGYSNLSTIEGIEYLNTSEVTNMTDMFNECSGLTSIDLSHFDTRNVTSMQYMFYGCSGLTSLDVSSFNTAKVVDFSGMFGYCTSLKTLDLSSFNTCNVTCMLQMFLECTSLKTLDLSSFNTSNVENMLQLFWNCSSLKTIYAGGGWSTEKVPIEKGGYLFQFCSNVVGGMGTEYDSSHTDKTYARIDGGALAPGYFTAPAGGIVTNIEAIDSHVEESSAPLYNLQGQRVSQPVKGQIYIQGGKKVRF